MKGGITEGFKRGRLSEPVEQHGVKTVFPQVQNLPKEQGSERRNLRRRDAARSCLVGERFHGHRP